jgi:hypothetical protein
VESRLADDANIAQQPDSELFPLMETVRAENQRLHIELGNSSSEKKITQARIARSSIAT